MEVVEEEDNKLQRSSANYEPAYTRFLLQSKNYVQQYNELYMRRMELMMPHLRARAAQKWGSAQPILSKIIDIDDEHHKTNDCALVGMVFKDLKLRGSVIQGNNAAGMNSTAAICSDKDTLILEDPSGRVVLSGAIAQHASSLVTGVIVAVKGKINDFGELECEDWVFSFDAATASEESSSSQSAEEAKYVLFVSGLSVGSSGEGEVHDLSLQLLADFVGGRLGDEQSAQLASRVVRVVVAGNSIVAPTASAVKDRFQGKQEHSSLSTPSKQLDLWVAQILNSCNVDIMPGWSDPANIALPQQPFHPCIFPQSARFNSFERISNPAEIRLDGVKITGHAGQPIADIARQTLSSTTSEKAESPETETEERVEDMESIPLEDMEETVVIDAKPQKLHSDVHDSQRRLEILQDTLTWGHLCPTAPDTTPFYPFTDTDPFIISTHNVPDVLFSGNQPAFATKLVNVDNESKQVRLICVPSFRQTGIAVLCNISHPKKLCFTMCFK